MLLQASRAKVYRLRPGTTEDSYGDPVEDWSVPEKKPLLGAKVEHAETVEEDGVTRYVRRDERVLFVSGSPDLTREDRIEHKGEVWKIGGTPNYRKGLASGAYVTARLTQEDIGGA